jgi:hypothetical protein
MQIIYDLTGGRLPAFWRPPFGDVDNRVRAIAEQVFGLKTVLWNKDTNDWAIGNNPKYTSESVQDTLTGWFTGPKSPGLLCLEHELNKNTIDVFINEHDVIVQNGWQVKSVPDAFNLQWYQNANGNTGDVSPGNIAGGAGAAQTTTTSSPSPSPSQSPSGQPSQTSNSLSTTSSDTRSKSSGSFTPLGTSTSSTSTKPSKTTTSIRESSTLNAAQNNKDSAAGTIAVPAAGVALAAIFALAF